jgi:hypothetical protein
MEDEIKKRGPGRPPLNIAPAEVDTMRNDLRHDLRASDPQEAARQRAAEILAQLGDSLGEEDKFFIPDELKQPGWDYEWKRFSVYNAEDQGYINGLKRTGWNEVPANRAGFDRFLPRNWKESFILKEGQLLMERPTEVSDEIKRRQLGQARERIKIAESQNGQAPPGTLPRDNNGNRIAVHGVSGAKRTIVGAIPN